MIVNAIRIKIGGICDAVDLRHPRRFDLLPQQRVEVQSLKPLVVLDIIRASFQIS